MTAPHEMGLQLSFHVKVGNTFFFMWNMCLIFLQNTVKGTFGQCMPLNPLAFQRPLTSGGSRVAYNFFNMYFQCLHFTHLTQVRFKMLPPLGFGIPSVLPPCVVCGAKGGGLHYGVNTCNSCKVSTKRKI